MASSHAGQDLAAWQGLRPDQAAWPAATRPRSGRLASSLRPDQAAWPAATPAKIWPLGQRLRRPRSGRLASGHRLSFLDISRILRGLRRRRRKPASSRTPASSGQTRPHGRRPPSLFSPCSKPIPSPVSPSLKPIPAPFFKMRSGLAAWRIPAFRYRQRKRRRRVR
ncbi:hypothetical protein SLA2020_359240 [Shorea laevis]